MASESRHISEPIARPAGEVYAYASDPANIPEWAPGLGTSVEEVDGHWFVETPTGRAAVTFAPLNEFGVLDQDVTLPSGQVVHNPIRVIPDGDDSEVIFTLRRLPGMSDEEFDRDEGLVAADLARLREVMERR
ncbi:SRPBCC family protein [Streptomyces sp. 6N223]|uniref:SRPBCC family protein n=1 Tax=Streptomyces sp. 6N223 TaxID=3457412 RepID=UPI003FD1BE4A